MVDSKFLKLTVEVGVGLGAGVAVGRGVAVGAGVGVGVLGDGADTELIHRLTVC